ncbi:hypothetical protein D9M68_362420 [compost metagenome]
MRKRNVLLCLSLSTALAGCGSPKDANKGNFERAIQSYLDTQPQTICASVAGIEPPFLLPKDTPLKQRELKQLDALADAGLLSRSDTQVEVEQGFMTVKKVQVPGYQYAITDAGKPFFKTGKKQAWGYDRGAFCFGQPKVEAVQSFTEPADMMGMKISKVTYVYQVAGVPAWADNPAVTSAYPQLAAEAKRTEGKAVLVLTDSDWVHEKLLK